VVAVLAAAVTGGCGGGAGSANLSNGQTYSFTFRTKGTISYICTIHPFMEGTITVQ
jgi:plastocyanin